MPDLLDLKCSYSRKAFTCIINSDYFEYYPYGYYNLYNLNDLKTYSLLYEVPPFEVILPKIKIIKIKIKENDNKEPIIIGEKGIIYLVTNYNDNKRNIFDASDIEEKTKFETMIYEDLRSNIIYCRLWKPIIDNLRIICKLNNVDITQKFKLETVNFNYNEYIINISFEKYLTFKKINNEIPFLYSDRQFIDIREDIENYNLKFKIETYNNELLYLYGEVNNSLIIDKCQKNEKELSCYVSREKLEEILIKINEQFRVGALNYKEGLVKFIGVLNITINHKITKKEDIYIGIIGSLTDDTIIRIPFGFKTNVTNLPNIYSDFKDNCYFKKFNDNPLLYLCRFDTKREFIFGNLTNEIVLNNLHYKYNFRIQPFKEIFNVSINNNYYKADSTQLIFPEILDFTSDDTLTFTLIILSPSIKAFLNLNPNTSSFECEDLNEMKKCHISLSHFRNEKSGYFYLHYLNTKRYYDLPPIKVILPNSLVEIIIDDNYGNSNKYIGERGILNYKTNYNDNETNIFDDSDIEKKISFITTLNSYIEINCRFWKPLNENMWLFCKLNDSLRKTEEQIKIKDVSFHYKEYAIMVIFNNTYFRVNTLNVSVPLLYSEKQMIDIKEEIDSYNLKFHIELYNGQPLYLYLEELKNIILQDCKETGKDLICNIKKEKFYEIYANNGKTLLELYPCDYL